MTTIPKQAIVLLAASQKAEWLEIYRNRETGEQPSEESWLERARNSSASLRAIEAALRTGPTPEGYLIARNSIEAIASGSLDPKQIALDALAALSALPVQDATEGDWLIRQLEEWPTRVDPDKTTNIEYLMKAAAARLRTAERQALERAAMVAEASYTGTNPQYRAAADGIAKTIRALIPSKQATPSR